MAAGVGLTVLALTYGCIQGAMPVAMQGIFAVRLRFGGHPLIGTTPGKRPHLTHGRIAKARAGKPRPFFTFGQVTTISAPFGGTLSRLAIASI